MSKLCKLSWTRSVSSIRRVKKTGSIMSLPGYFELPSLRVSCDFNMMWPCVKSWHSTWHVIQFKRPCSADIIWCHVLIFDVMIWCLDVRPGNHTFQARWCQGRWRQLSRRRSRSTASHSGKVKTYLFQSVGGIKKMFN